MNPLISPSTIQIWPIVLVMEKHQITRWCLTQNEISVLFCNPAPAGQIFLLKLPDFVLAIWLTALKKSSLSGLWAAASSLLGQSWAWLLPHPWHRCDTGKGQLWDTSSGLCNSWVKVPYAQCLANDPQKEEHAGMGLWLYQDGENSTGSRSDETAQFSQSGVSPARKGCVMVNGRESEVALNDKTLSLSFPLSGDDLKCSVSVLPAGVWGMGEVREYPPSGPWLGPWPTSGWTEQQQAKQSLCYGESNVMEQQRLIRKYW